MAEFNPDTTRDRYTVVRTASCREEMVEQFHRANRLPVDVPPRRWAASQLKRHIRRLHDEYYELMEELETQEAIHFTLSDGPTRPMVERLLKELAELQWELSSTAVSLGLDLEAATRRVHEARMASTGATKVHPNLKDLVP